jgi:mono/diheme cytochrome c family protein
MRRTLLFALLLAALPACSRDRELPEPYRRLKVPKELLDSPAARSRGRALYLASCVLCHGEKGDGRGVRREGLSQAPRDFTDVGFRRRTTPRQLFAAIREGVRGTAMPAWKSLTDEETWDLVAYVLALSAPGPPAGADDRDYVTREK